ncbi:uncharacterized protein [Ptychodera flava]|uniref:uncharacterized protein n=1 Tax=Ptychodera flava TaxID=63121 RepID=UPI00396A109A
MNWFSVTKIWLMVIAFQRIPTVNGDVSYSSFTQAYDLSQETINLQKSTTPFRSTKGTRHIHVPTEYMVKSGIKLNNNETAGNFCYAAVTLTSSDDIILISCSSTPSFPSPPPRPPAPTLPNITTTTPVTTTSSYTTEISTSSTMITEAPSTSATFLTTEISSTTPSQPQTTEETTREPLTQLKGPVTYQRE